MFEENFFEVEELQLENENVVSYEETLDVDRYIRAMK